MFRAAWLWSLKRKGSCGRAPLAFAQRGAWTGSWKRKPLTLDKAHVRSLCRTRERSSGSMAPRCRMHLSALRLAWGGRRRYQGARKFCHHSHCRRRSKSGHSTMPQWQNSPHTPPLLLDPSNTPCNRHQRQQAALWCFRGWHSRRSMWHLRRRRSSSHYLELQHQSHKSLRGRWSTRTAVPRWAAGRTLGGRLFATPPLRGSALHASSMLTYSNCHGLTTCTHSVVC